MMHQGITPRFSSFYIKGTTAASTAGTWETDAPVFQAQVFVATAAIDNSAANASNGNGVEVEVSFNGIQVDSKTFYVGPTDYLPYNSANQYPRANASRVSFNISVPMSFWTGSAINVSLAARSLSNASNDYIYWAFTLHGYWCNVTLGGDERDKFSSRHCIVR
ncbi:MAG TPA: hypothetical protein VKM55_00020 [Candidatus Lokiarchaeia archaeon]|nr:hypothetical protein [Candidatus Lokiarchaeia archaeon]